MKITDLLFIIIGAIMFAIISGIVFDREAEKEDRQNIDRAFEDAAIRAHEIRQSGIIGLNLNQNPEL